MRKLIYIGLLSIFVLSCDRGALKSEVKQLMANPITMGNDYAITYHGNDTIMSDWMKSDLKMVIYNDSTGCGSCAVGKMDVWNNIIKNTSSYNGRLKFYFIYAPEKGNLFSLKLALKSYKFDYPVLIDTNNNFLRNNPTLPKNKRLHTFLLDENNRVILVGSPLHNKKIEEMFYAEVKKRLGDGTSAGM